MAGPSFLFFLIFLILPGVFRPWLLLIPVGIWLRRRKLKEHCQHLEVYPAINLREPMVRRAAFVVGAAAFLNVLMFGTASYRGVEYMDATQVLRANLSHCDDPGVYRLSDIPTRARTGTITNDCSSCHNLLAVEETNPKILAHLGLP